MNKEYLNAVRCGDCGTDVVLSKDGDKRLHAECECDSRSIKVAKRLPNGWSA